LVAKSAITLKGARRGFAGARPGNRALSGYLDLQRRVDDPRITRSSPYTGRLYVHQFRISAPGELDDEFADWIHEAYQVGNGAHLGARAAHDASPVIGGGEFADGDHGRRSAGYALPAAARVRVPDPSGTAAMRSCVARFRLRNLSPPDWISNGGSRPSAESVRRADRRRRWVRTVPHRSSSGSPGGAGQVATAITA
jgi:hypothetical protein